MNKVILTHPSNLTSSPTQRPRPTSVLRDGTRTSDWDSRPQSPPSRVLTLTRSVHSLVPFPSVVRFWPELLFLPRCTEPSSSEETTCTTFQNTTDTRSVTRTLLLMFPQLSVSTKVTWSLLVSADLSPRLLDSTFWRLLLLSVVTRSSPSSR